MTPHPPAPPAVSRAAVPAADHATGRALIWTGYGLTGFVALFLLFDGAARVAGLAPYVEGTVVYGYPESYATAIGITLLASTILYLVPRTAVLGAILLTGYLGGAAASQLTIQDPWFLFPVVFGMMAWSGLWLREPRLRALVPLKRAVPPSRSGHARVE